MRARARAAAARSLGTMPSELLPEYMAGPPNRAGTFAKDVKDAIRHNDVDALSFLLSLPVHSAEQDDFLENNGEMLLSLAIESDDAAECALYLLNYLEELRRARHAADGYPEARYPERPDETGPEANARWASMVRAAAIEHRESYCGAAPTSVQLLTLARHALAPPAPAPRCGRALLLQAHRLRKQHPAVGRAMVDPSGAAPLRDSEGVECVAWPPVPADLPAALMPRGGSGGLDLSLGGAAVPLQWINEVDLKAPPPIVFVREAIDVDVRPDWRGKPAKACTASHNQRAPSVGAARAAPCADNALKWGAPDGHFASATGRATRALRAGRRRGAEAAARRARRATRNARGGSCSAARRTGCKSSATARRAGASARSARSARGNTSWSTPRSASRRRASPSAASRTPTSRFTRWT